MEPIPMPIPESVWGWRQYYMEVSIEILKRCNL